MRACVRMLALAALAVLLSAGSALADTWAIYWYVCGSDLERRFGGASADIAEAMRARFGKDVTVVLQTGGTTKWRNTQISPRKIQRYLIRQGRLELVQNLPQGDMGNKDTLADFLEFCSENYDADHRALIVWDHGGGGAGRFSHDENSGNAMRVKHLREALEAVWDPDPKDPPLDIIGFDACLMGSLEVAEASYGFATHLVASEQLEPGEGWNYTGFLSALGARTNMDAATLGRHICDTYIAGCNAAGQGRDVTLSVVDLGKLPRLRLAWNCLGLEAFARVAKDKSYFAVLGRYANASENYDNVKGESYSNMVDLGDFVSHLRKSQPELAGELATALRSAVVYRVNGPLQHSSGLSFYYPLDGGKTYSRVLELGRPSAFLVLQGLMTGRMNSGTAKTHTNRIVKDAKAELARMEREEEQAEGTPSSRPRPPQTAGTPSSRPRPPQTAGTPSFQPSLPQLAGTPSSQPRPPQAGGSPSHREPAAQALAATEAAVHAAAAPRPQPRPPHAGGSPSHREPAAQALAAAEAAVHAAATPSSQPRPPQEASPASALSLHDLAQAALDASQHALPAVQPLELRSLEQLDNPPVTVNADGEITMQLKPADLTYVDDVYVFASMVDFKKDLLVILGIDADLSADWDKAVFKDNFRNVWPTLDGHVLMLLSVAIEENRYRYRVPLKLNGEKVLMEMIYDFDDGKYKILGARSALSDGTPDKLLRPLKPGDKVTTIIRAKRLKMPAVDMDMDSFTLTADSQVKDEDLGDGDYCLLFQMRDVQGNVAVSDGALVHVENGKITKEEAKPAR